MITAPPELTTFTAQLSPLNAIVARDANGEVTFTPVRPGVFEAALMHGQLVQIRALEVEIELVQGLLSRAALVNLGVTLRLALAYLSVEERARVHTTAVVTERLIGNAVARAQVRSAQQHLDTVRTLDEHLTRARAAVTALEVARHTALTNAQAAWDAALAHDPQTTRRTWYAGPDELRRAANGGAA